MAEIEILRGLGLSSLTYLLGHFQRVTVHEGDITVKNNDTLLIENCQFNLTGRLVIMDKAEVIIRNCKFISNWNFSEPAERIWEQPWRTRHLIIRNQAKLTVLNSELTFIGYYAVDSYLTVYDHATLNMTRSRITEPVNHIEACNNSKIWIKDTAISTFIPPELYGHYPPRNALIISGQPQVEVQNSIIDEMYLGPYWSEANCIVTISNSKIERFTTSRDSSVANIVNSHITSQLEIDGPKSNVRLVNARVDVLRAFGSSKVWLLESSVRYIYMADEAKVWVIWNLPLFGQVVVPHAWIHAWTLYARPVTVFLITLIVTIAFIFFLHPGRVYRKLS